MSLNTELNASWEVLPAVYVLCLNTCSRVNEFHTVLPMLLFKELGPELLGGLSELNSTSRVVHFWRCELECDLATSWEHILFKPACWY